MNIIVFITAKNILEAKKISRKLLEVKLVACCNIVKGVQSFFWWQGKVDNTKETLLILKTKKNCFKKIIRLVKSLHSYETPEIIALPIIDGDKDYLKWLDASLNV